jgi:hypothetical protein
MGWERGLCERPANGSHHHDGCVVHVTRHLSPGRVRIQTNSSDVKSGKEKKEKSGRQQRRGDFNFFRRRRRRYDGKKRAKHTPVEELVDL